MESTVNFNTKLKEAASFGQPITEYDPGSRGYKDFVNLARELMGHTSSGAGADTDGQAVQAAGTGAACQATGAADQLQFGRNAIPAAGPCHFFPAGAADSH